VNVPLNVPSVHMRAAERRATLRALFVRAPSTKPPERTDIMTSNTTLPRMHGSSVYRVRVRGRLDARWFRDLSGMEVTEERGPGDEFRTTLVGRLLDQAALFGVLNSLYELHLPVLSVDCLENGDD